MVLRVITLEIINNDGNRQWIGQNETGLLSVLSYRHANCRAMQLV